MWSLVGFSGFRRGAHAYAHVGSTNRILWIINNIIKENINLGGGYLRGYEGCSKGRKGLNMIMFYVLMCKILKNKGNDEI